MKNYRDEERGMGNEDGIRGRVTKMRNGDGKQERVITGKEMTAAVKGDG